MTIIFRELNQEEEELLLIELNYWLLRSNIDSLKKQYSFVIAEGNWREILISNFETKKLLKEKNISPYSIGLKFCEIKENKIELGLPGIQIIGDVTNKKVIVTPEAEQAFLYRNDIICESVIEMNQELNINEKAIVKNKEGESLGIGKIMVLPINLKKKQFSKTIAIKNLMDLGWYLRKGK
ncbi:MAG: hypothetical protein EAX90_03415 [Candidatus Heimdallarchaeota archaeon]|nr:hypothetical protein [Candidatus Heimdallarchaeota archaeon]